MKNLNELSNAELLTQVKSLAAEERRLTVEILKFLREVERRQLYLERGYSNLISFCENELGYSSAAAWRRIEAMRLLKDVPGADEKILTGELNITTLSKVSQFVKQEKKRAKWSPPKLSKIYSMNFAISQRVRWIKNSKSSLQNWRPSIKML